METVDILCQMIQQHRVVELAAANDPEGEVRVVEPHAVYLGSNNRGFVDFYQRVGWSRSGKLPGWRRLALSDVLAVRAQEETFVPRPDYRPDNRQWYRAFVCRADVGPSTDTGDFASPEST